MADDAVTKDTPEEAPVSGDELNIETVSKGPEDLADIIDQAAEKAREEMVAEEEAGLESEAAELKPETELEGEEEPREEETPEEPQTFLEFLKSQGIEKTYQDDREAWKGAAEAMRLIGERNEAAMRWRELRERGYSEEEIQNLFDAYEQAKEESRQRAEVPQLGWQPPVELKPAMSEEEREKYEEYVAQKWRQYQNDPVSLVREVVYPMLLPEMQRLADAVAAKAEADKIITENEAFLKEYATEVRKKMDEGWTSAAAIDYVKWQLEKEGKPIPGAEKKGENAKKADMAKAAARGTKEYSRRTRQTKTQARREPAPGEDPNDILFDLEEAMKEVGL